MQPGDRALDYPARGAQPAPVGFAAAGDQRSDAGSVQRLAVLVVVVAAIALHELRFAQRPAALAANRRERGHQWVQLRDVVAVSTGENQRERDALRFGDEVVLGAGASAIGGIGSCF